MAVTAYAAAVFQRSSLSVAGIVAQHRFHADPAELSLFAVLQLGVYAALQIPVGALADRIGPKRLILFGAGAMCLGQSTLAWAHAVPTAVVARVIVGAGDALTFVSVLRQVPTWFPARRVSLVSQLTSTVGQLGQLAAAYPLVYALHGLGWTPTYLGAAALSVIVAMAVALGLTDGAPPRTSCSQLKEVHPARAVLVAVWREPGTRLGLWTHFSTMFAGTTFGILWGYPFLVAGEGLTPPVAGALLTLQVVVAMSLGPPVGKLVADRRRRASVAAFGVVGATASVWSIVLLWPGPAPIVLLIALELVLGMSGPGSMLGFELARIENPLARLGSASGIVNVGGFVSTLTTIFLIGAILSVVAHGSHSGTYSLSAMKHAFAAQYVIWAVGIWGMWRNASRLAKKQGSGTTLSVHEMQHDHG